MRWFPVAFFVNGVFIVTRIVFELTTPVLSVDTLNHYTAALTAIVAWYLSLINYFITVHPEM